MHSNSGRFLGFIKFYRGMNAEELIERNPFAFTLLAVIALRARRTDTPNPFGLKAGQAFIGDWRRCGMSEQNYRTAKKVLQANRLVTFRTTPRGTIATLVSTEIFDINRSDEAAVALREPQAANRLATPPATTNKEAEEERRGEEKPPANGVPVKQQTPIRLSAADRIHLEKERERNQERIDILWRADFRNPEERDELKALRERNRKIDAAIRIEL